MRFQSPLSVRISAGNVIARSRLWQIGGNRLAKAAATGERLSPYEPWLRTGEEVLKWRQPAIWTADHLLTDFAHSNLMSGLEVLGAVAGGLALAKAAFTIYKRISRLAERVGVIEDELKDLAQELYLLSVLTDQFVILVNKLTNSWTASCQRQKNLALAVMLENSIRTSIQKLEYLIDKAEPRSRSSRMSFWDQGVAQLNWWLETPFCSCSRW